MIQVSIDSLMVGFVPSSSIVSLRASSANSKEFENQTLPIRVGLAEATAIAAALENKHGSRPLTHTLMNDLVKAAGGQISRIVIDRVEGETFFATVMLLHSDGHIVSIDARPSDAIALAIRAQMPLFVEDDVMNAASIPIALIPGADARLEIEEFHNFIENVTPDDFVNNSTN